jgi:hypothetical protein
MQWIPASLSPGVKRPGREAQYSLPSAEVKNAWRYTSTPQYVFMAWRLVKHRDNFTFYGMYLESLFFGGGIRLTRLSIDVFRNCM